MATKSKVDAKPIGTIRDINDRKDLILVDTSQDVEEIKKYLGSPPWFDDFGGCFVKVGEGDYEEIYCYEGSVPYLEKTLYKIEW